MPDKRKIRWIDQPSSTNWAIGIVVALIGITAVAIVALLVMTSEGGPDLSQLIRPETAQSTATPRPQPTQPVWETPTPPMTQRPSQPTPVPANDLPTRPGKSVNGDTAVSTDTGYVHPTFQPTTEPCQTCHEEMRQGQ